MARAIGTNPASRSGILSYLSLFTSFGTLLCCALPSLLVLAGLGATVASFLSSVPWLVTLSQHKNWVFTISGVLIGVNVLLQARGGACPVDTPEACTRASRMSRAMLWTSGIIYCIGFLSAYLLGPLLMRFA